MKKLVFLMIIVNSLLACQKNEFGPVKQNLSMPGRQLDDMAMDLSGNLWLQTSEVDVSYYTPGAPNELPYRYYLIKVTQERYEVIDNNFMGAKKMIFDRNDRLWFITGRKVYYLKNSQYVPVYTLPDSTGHFDWIANDLGNNIWTGGLCAELVMIKPDLGIKKYTRSDTPFAVDSIRTGHVDRKNNLWLVLHSGRGLVRLDSSGSWTIYNSTNPAMTKKDIWCITSDADHNIWIGTNYDQQFGNLIKYDGTEWIKVPVNDEMGFATYGNVRHLFADYSKIWVVVYTTRYGEFYRSYVLTYDGIKWNRIRDLPGTDGIKDIEIDNANGKVWIGTNNNGCIQVNIN